MEYRENSLTYQEYVSLRSSVGWNNFAEEQVSNSIKYSLQGTTQGRYLTGGVPPVRFSM